MWSYVSEFSIVAMVALCLAVGAFARNRSRLGRQLVFLFGTFVLCPLFGFAMYQSISQHVVDEFRSSDKFYSFEFGVIALGTLIAFVIWLVIFWISSAIGWVNGRHENAKWNIFSGGFLRDPGWEESYFRKVPEGWIIRGFWPFGHNKNYLLSDKQRVDAAVYFRSLRKPRAIYVLVFLVVFGGSILLSSAPSPLNDSLLGQLIYFAILFICALIWFGFDYRRRLLPILAGAQQTTQAHYSYIERFKINATSMSFATLILFGLLSIAFFIDGIYNLSKSSEGGWNLFANLLQTAVFGFGTIMWIGMLVIKLKVPTERSSS